MDEFLNEVKKISILEWISGIGVILTGTLVITFWCVVICG